MKKLDLKYRYHKIVAELRRFFEAAQKEILGFAQDLRDIFDDQKKWFLNKINKK
jgi:hypothetical protein